MDIRLVDITKVKPYEKNPRKNMAAIDKVAASIKEFGFQQPIVVDANGIIIVGHTRHKAALKLGLTEVPVVYAEGLTPAQVKAYRLSDNKTNSFGEWDLPLLGDELKDLEELKFDMICFGFDKQEPPQIQDIDELLNKLETKNTIEKPIWITIRTSVENKDKVEEGLRKIEENGIRIERSYEME